MPHHPTPRLPLLSRLGVVLRQYAELGFTSFGGPGVHVIILRERFVDRLKWVDERTFIDLFALGNALPGPGSTQLAFSIAVVKHGVLPGILAFLCWSLPGALGMAGLAAGISSIPSEMPPLALALLSGLNAAAVGLIALAAYQLGTAASTDRIALLLVWLSASFGICYHAPWMYPTLIVAGGATTLLWDFRRQWFMTPAKRAWRSRSKAEVSRETHETEVERVASRTAHLSAPLQPLSPSLLESLTPPDRSYQPTPTQLAQATALPSPPASPISPPIAVQADPSTLRLTSSSTTQRRLMTGSTSDVEATPVESPPSADLLQVVSFRSAWALIGGFVLLLVVPLATRGGLANAGKHVPRELDFFANMILAGTIIFGGGPVVIPLLRDYVVVPGWVSSRDFLLIFAILQAFPGPNFNFAVALGFLALPFSTSSRILGAILGYIGIFSPGILLKLGLLPLYSSWRDKAIARSVIRGLNAAAAGLVFTAVWQLFLVGYIYSSADGQGGVGGQTVSGPLTADPFWAVVAAGAFLSNRNFGCPAWGSIAGGGLAGMAWYGVRSS